MKEFNLDEALLGKPVKLRSGQKAIVCYRIPDEYVFEDGTASAYPLRGLIFNKKGYLKSTIMCWKDNGLYDQYNHHHDIIEMWEEPKLTSEQVLEKAYNEDLLVLCDGNPDLPLKIIAKTKDGEFVMQPEDDTIQPWLANLTMEWFFAKDLDPKFGTITNTIALPKPFKPDIGDEFFYLSVGTVQYCSFYSDINADLMRGGQCFREREDAQKWLDFMKSMME